MCHFDPHQGNRWIKTKENIFIKVMLKDLLVQKSLIILFVILFDEIDKKWI